MGIIENAKEAVKLVQQMDNIDLYRQILDLQSEAIALTEELKQKDDTITKLEQALRLKGKIVCENSAYYIIDNDGNKVDGPFCTKCFDVDHTTCRLIISGNPRAEGRDWEWIQCPKCKVTFKSRTAGEYIQTH